MSPIIILTVASRLTRCTCPNCKSEASIKKVCRHCGYEYVEKQQRWVEVVQVFAIVFGGAVIIASMITAICLAFRL